MSEKIALVVQGLFEKSDSIGYDCVGEYHILKAMHIKGAQIRIFAENINPNNYPDVPIEHITRLKPWLEAGGASTVIYHWCDGWPNFDRLIPCLNSRIIVRWHNNTPPWFFPRFSSPSVVNTIRGYTSILKVAESSQVEFWANSVYTAKQLAFLGVERRRIHVLYPVSPFLMTIREGTESQKSLPKVDESLKLLFVGRVVPHKGHRHLLATAAMIQQATQRRVKLTMVGRSDGSDPQYVDELKHLAQKLLVDAVFPGEIPLSTLATLYDQSDVFLYLSEHEGFGLPVFEAMRAGLPVVGLRSTAVGEFLQNHPLAVPSIDYSAAAVRVIAAAHPPIRNLVVAWQRTNILRYYSQDIVARQLLEGLSGDYAWPAFGGTRDIAIEGQVGEFATRFEPQFLKAASDLRSLSQIPTDTIDRLMTRYDIEAYGAVIDELKKTMHEKDFFRQVMTTVIPSDRFLISPLLGLVRRIVLSVQAGLVMGLSRLNGQIHAEVSELKRGIDDIRDSIERLQRVSHVGRSSLPLNGDPMSGNIAPVLDQGYGRGDGGSPDYTSMPPLRSRMSAE